MRIVIAQWEALEMVVCAHAQVVGDALADTFGDVVVDITRDGAKDRNQEEG